MVVASSIFCRLSHLPPPSAASVIASFLLLVWFAICWISVHVAASTGSLSTIVEYSHLEIRWSLAPLITAVAGLLLAHLRANAELRLQTDDRFLHLAWLAGALSVVRLVSLWNPLCQLFPYLTLLWSPHATWGLCLCYMVYPNLAIGTDWNRSPVRYLAITIFLLCSVGYGIYTLYFCQVTMIHGDEGQYLRVTQSLIRDGDMDLANNLDSSTTDEFHITDFGLAKAPASPTGKVHSVHPIGLSVLLVPAYWLGLELWSNPRLACALFMCLLAAATSAAAFVWLCRVGISVAAALIAVFLLATTAPFFLYSNQLYPEMPALLIALITLSCMPHWQRSEGVYQSVGRWEIAWLGLLALLAWVLPFLHPRYLPLTALLLALLLLQCWFSVENKRNIVSVLAVSLVMTAVHIRFNYTFSNDWLGPFRPGNAWSEGSLNPAVWFTSLPGHWLLSTHGLLNAAPVFLYSLVGLTLLARTRSRLALVCCALYICTAAVNGAHPDWTFGFGYPGRFLITALPVLVLGLAWSFGSKRQTALGLFLLAMAWTVSLDTVTTTVEFPEGGYNGVNHEYRSVNQYYPWQVHFTPDRDSVAVSEIVLCGILVLAGARFLGRYQPALVLLALLAPKLWSTAIPTQRIADSAVGLTYDNPAHGEPRIIPVASSFELDLTNQMVGTREPDGTFLPREGRDALGLLVNLDGPLLDPGYYSFDTPDLFSKSPIPRVTGHLVSLLYTNVPAVSRSRIHLSKPIVPSPSPGVSQAFYVGRISLGRFYVEYSGFGEIGLEQFSLRQLPMFDTGSPELIKVFEHDEKTSDGPIAAGVFYPRLEPGFYRVVFTFNGPLLPGILERSPRPIALAVYTVDPSVPSKYRGRQLVDLWFEQNRLEFSGIDDPDYVRPLAERFQSPWWISIPDNEHAMDINFSLPDRQDTWFLVRYDGDEHLNLQTTTLFKKKVQLTFPPTETGKGNSI